MASNIDRYHRRITYLRISVTDRCNLRCIYCRLVKDLELVHHDEILRYEEILPIIEAGTGIGITKVRLTGGEPLVRKHFVHLVESVCKVPGLKDVSITTNGVRLKKKAKEIFQAGVHRINVSLDTLNRLKYIKITGRDYFDNVWEGLQEAEAVGFSPIKVNVVAMRGFNDDELMAFAKLSLEKPYHVRFIEYMPVGKHSPWERERYISSDEIRSKIEPLGPLHKVPRSVHDGPASRYRLPSAAGEIGFITAMSHHFCTSCNRLRLTADGKLRPCLFSDDEIDIRGPLRRGCSGEDLKALFKTAIARKPKEHQATIFKTGASKRPMSAIGG
ncbi:MAG: GTP 3',8-cyclase MoaA [Thermodesulfobacteriota bacterium]|nr:GTP 3',8-cyclase MoaA [Thermodesulfobacteriota bacterium]